MKRGLEFVNKLFFILFLFFIIIYYFYLYLLYIYYIFLLFLLFFYYYIISLFLLLLLSMNFLRYDIYIKGNKDLLYLAVKYVVRSRYREKFGAAHKLFSYFH